MARNMNIAGFSGNMTLDDFVRELDKHPEFTTQTMTLDVKSTGESGIIVFARGEAAAQVSEFISSINEDLE